MQGSTEKRLALVVGNAKYREGGVLRNPINDASEISAVLSNLGFEIVGGTKNGTDLTVNNFLRLAQNFADRLDEEKPSVSLLYYAGHGIQINGLNFLVPID